MLTQRWGIFWRPFQFSFQGWSLVVLATMKLHNFALIGVMQFPHNVFMKMLEKEINGQYMIMPGLLTALSQH
jgi:hypothetical protein